MKTSPFTPLSNRGVYSVCQKTNLKAAVSVDKIRLWWWVNAEQPSMLLNRVFGAHSHRVIPNRWVGPRKTDIYSCLDSSTDSRGGAYFMIQADQEPLPTSKKFRTKCVLEVNPNFVSEEKWGYLDHWVESLGEELTDGWVDRIDIAFDFELPRDLMTVQHSPRRKVEVIREEGATGRVQTCRTLVPKGSRKYRNIGYWNLYDKQAQLREKFEEHVMGPWTRCELNFRLEDEVKLLNLGNMELPPLGGELKYMPIDLNKYNVDAANSRFYRLAQLYATHDPKAAHAQIVDYARLTGHTCDTAEEFAECIMTTVQLQQMWDDARDQVATDLLASTPKKHARTA